MPTNYLSDRLERQIKWYDDKSVEAKKNLSRVTFFSVLCTSLIPIVTLFIDFFPFLAKVIVTLLSQIVNICTWYINFNKLQEIRISYRSICENLKTQKFLYENRCSPYNDSSTALSLLISNCESIMDEEHKNWSTIFNKNSKPVDSHSIGS